eukprot:365091_1
MSNKQLFEQFISHQLLLISHIKSCKTSDKLSDIMMHKIFAIFCDKKNVLTLKDIDCMEHIQSIESIAYEIHIRTGGMLEIYSIYRAKMAVLLHNDDELLHIAVDFLQNRRNCSDPFCLGMNKFWMLYGAYFRYVTDFKRAKYCLQMALQVNPNDIFVISEYINLMRQYGKNRIATKYLNKLKQFDINWKNVDCARKNDIFRINQRKIHHVFDICNWCEEKGFDFKKCSKCKIVFYCSKKCQKLDWKQS